MEEGIIKDVYEKIIKELQTLITLSYLLMVAVGMMFKYHLYAQFGINIFDYADVFDFLITPFSDPKILLFTVASITLSYTIILLDIFWKKNSRDGILFPILDWIRKNGLKPIEGSCLVLFLLFILFLPQKFMQITPKKEYEHKKQ